jgi:hypothetical protein
MPTLNAEHSLQVIEQHNLHPAHHLTLDCCASNQRHQLGDSQFLQELEELIQHSRFVRALDPVDDLLPISDTGVGRLVCRRDERPPNTTVPSDSEEEIIFRVRQYGRLHSPQT